MEYNLLAYGAPFTAIPVHPSILPVAEAWLGDELLLSSLSAIQLDPGQGAQPLHADSHCTDAAVGVL